MRIHENATSPVGWYLVTIIERFEPADRKSPSPEMRCTAWENMYLVKAASIEQAYDKLLSYEKEGQSEEQTELRGVKGKWVFEGITEVLPIYDEIEDLAEIRWREYKSIRVKTVKEKVLSKREVLSFFQENGK